MKTFDLSLYLVTDSRHHDFQDFLETVRLAVEGGVTLVQLREKNAPKNEIFEKALALRQILKPRNVPLIIDDHVDIAKEVHADGVHLGKRDGDVKSARKVLGENAIIGWSIESVEEFERISLEGCDYFSASPVFVTATKGDIAKPLGIENLKILRKLCPLPLVAIGGINVQNIPALAQSGIDGIAVVSQIMFASEPKQSASLLKETFEKFRVKPHA